MKVHKFNESIQVGNEGEAILDDFFKEKFVIEEVDLQVQKMGIDRVFTHRKDDTVCTVEYKTDHREGDTGNCFIETWSNKQAKKRGWAYTSQAQWLYYFLPSSNEVCVIEMLQVKMLVNEWIRKYKVTQCVNKSGEGFYNTSGVLVPSSIFKDNCLEVIKI